MDITDRSTLDNSIESRGRHRWTCSPWRWRCSTALPGHGTRSTHVFFFLESGPRPAAFPRTERATSAARRRQSEVGTGKQRRKPCLDQHQRTVARSRAREQLACPDGTKGAVVAAATSGRRVTHSIRWFGWFLSIAPLPCHGLH
jgi:hypothetical protein